jgi:transcriptional regulator with XRE-family HTH domain
MEMQIDAKLLKKQRTNRAWSQEHLAEVTGLGLRTIQRIETSGMASNESIAAIATVFDMTVAEFVRDAATEEPKLVNSRIQKNRLWIALVVLAVAQAVSPPQLTVALGGLGLWVALELGMLVVQKRANLKGVS